MGLCDIAGGCGGVGGGGVGGGGVSGSCGGGGCGGDGGDGAGGAAFGSLPPSPLSGLIGTLCGICEAESIPKSDGMTHRDEEEGAQRTIRGGPEKRYVVSKVDSLERGRRGGFIVFLRYFTSTASKRHIVVA